MKGSWTVPLGGATHAISADLNPLTGMLTVVYDGRKIGSWFTWIVLGKIRTFEEDGHSFEIHVKGYGAVFGHLALWVDGAEVDATGTPVPAAPPKPHPAPAAKPSAPPPPSAPAAPVLTFVKELSVTDTDEVIGIEDYPLDNSFGDSALTTDRQVSKASTNDLSIDLTSEVQGKMGLTLFSALNSEVTSRVSHDIGCKIGETVTETQTLHLSVAPKGSVLYRVLWKRKVRSGEHLYMADDEPVTVPYRVNFGLSCEVRTSALEHESS